MKVASLMIERKGKFENLKESTKISKKLKKFRPLLSILTDLEISR